MSHKRTILLIDDDELICEMTQGVLRKLGYECITAANAREARALFSGDPEQFDLIMVDHLLSDVSGVDLAADLLSVRHDTLIVLYTGGSAELEDVRSKGVRAVIPKGLTRQELAGAIERIFDER